MKVETFYVLGVLKDALAENSTRKTLAQSPSMNPVVGTPLDWQID
jgi:hypothetical protein